MTENETDALATWAADILAPLRTEADNYVKNFEYRHFNNLQKAGLNPARVLGARVLGVTPVEELAGDMWQPIEQGPLMVTVALYEDGAVTEIIAFDPAKPSRWLLRTGNAWALGMDRIKATHDGWLDEPLSVHATPFAWLQSDMDGCCVINWTNEARSTLLDMPKLRVPSAKFAAALRLELSRPPRLPEILYDRERVRAA